MRIISFFLLLSLVCSIPAVAGVKDIKADKLPTNTEVQNAYQEALRLEPVGTRWSTDWHYATPKATIAEQLEAQLFNLQQQAKAAPDNVELWLLISTVARFGYNLDVPNTHEVVVSATEKVTKLAPSDIRGRWFGAIHQCQTSDLVNEGMKTLLEIESTSPVGGLPASFWDDYMECGTTANMPAHVLRAGHQRQDIDPAVPDFQKELISIASNRFDNFDPGKKYEAKQIWQFKQDKSYPVFSSDLFGFSFAAKGDWPLDICIPEKSQCVVTMETGPLKGIAGDVIPNIVVIARQPKEKESIEDFFQHFMHYKDAHRVAVPCPSSECLTSEAISAGMYGKEGAGHTIMTAFQGAQPAYPGLLWEEPNGPPSPNADAAPVYYRPNRRMKRLAGTVYYLVMLDTAESVYPEARASYETFLKSMRVE